MLTAAKRFLKTILPERLVLAIQVHKILKDLDSEKTRRLIEFLRYLTFAEDGLATIHNCDFLEEPRFRQAYRLGKETGSFRGVDIRWRAHVICWAAQHAKNLEGDFVECGVYRGGLPRMVVDYINFPSLSKKFYLLDTFEGLNETYISQEEKNSVEPQALMRSAMKASKKPSAASMWKLSKALFRTLFPKSKPKRFAIYPWT